jgi:putative oxidoreductase
MQYLFYLARILFGGYFILNAFNHFKNVNSLVGYAQSQKVPNARLAVIGTGVLLLIGGLGILLWMFVPIAVLAITLFLIPVTFIMHPFWKIQDPMMRTMQYVNFTKNLALLGGALAFLFVGAYFVF